MGEVEVEHAAEGGDESAYVEGRLGENKGVD